MKYSIITQKIFKFNNLIVKYCPLEVFEIPRNYTDEADAIWQSRYKYALENNIRFYDGELYRLIDLSITDNGVSMTVGNCSYKDYVTTRTKNIVDNNNLPVFADPLAICSAVITSDSKILIGKRVGVDGSINKLHVIGGFVERSKDDENDTPSPFHAINREIYEEVGVEIPINNIICLGIIYVETLPHPEMCFYARTNLNYAAISKLKPLDLEVEEWKYIDDDPECLASYIIENYDNIASPGLANLIFYGEMRFGTQWFNNHLNDNLINKKPKITI